MQSSLNQILERYQPNNTAEVIQALREIIQEIALIGLWRSKFFEHAAFYGGTALRMFYQLNRFSEDLDFSLLRPNLDFSLAKYNQSIKEELESFGLKVEVETKAKNIETNIESAFIKANTKMQLLSIQFDQYTVSGIPRDSNLKIKLEVDTNPPPLFDTEVKVLSNPLPVSVRCYKPEYLFAGKMHALLCRLWDTRVKGRDWYDFAWFVARKTPLDLRHLEARMQQSLHLDPKQRLDISLFKEKLTTKIEQCNIESARQDISRFITDLSILDCWNKEYFLAITENIKYT